MKLTPYKLARIKSILPQEDIDEINKGDFSPELKSKLDQWMHRLAPKRLSKTKGAFGKKGTNRKMQIVERQIALIERIKEEKGED